jgi:hypothetical protein
MKRSTWDNRIFTLAAIAAITLCISQTGWADSFNFVLFQYPGVHISQGLGINNNGDMVGIAGEAPGFTADPIGFLYSSGSFTPIVAPGSTFTHVSGINNAGLIAGYTNTGSFLYSGGVFTPFPGPGSTQVSANGINDLGQVVGAYSAGAFFYNGSSFTTISVPGSTSTTANGLNNLGEIVGSYTIGSQTFGFLDNSGVFTTIFVPGSLSTSVFGINNLGELVGSYTDVLGSHGFVYDNGVFTKFDAPGATSSPDGPSTHGMGINDYGVVAGYQASSSGGQASIFVATPVPEPETLGLFGTGVMVLAGVVRRRWLH